MTQNLKTEEQHLSFTCCISYSYEGPVLLVCMCDMYTDYNVSVVHAGIIGRHGYRTFQIAIASSIPAHNKHLYRQLLYFVYFQMLAHF